MGFVDEFEEGGELGGDDVLDPIYLGKKSPGEYLVKVKEFRIDVHPEDRGKDNDGQEYAVAILELVQPITIQDGVDVVPGEELTLFLPMYTHKPKVQRKHYFREMVEFLAPASGKRPSEFRSNPKLVYEMADDDGEPVKGTFLHAKTKPPNDGYHNWQFKAVDEDDIDVDAAAE